MSFLFITANINNFNNLPPFQNTILLKYNNNNNLSSSYPYKIIIQFWSATVH